MAFNLIILCDTRVLPDRDFREIVKRVRRIAPDVHAFVANERSGLRRAQWAQLVRPTLFVQINRLQGLRRWRGTLARADPRLRGKMATYRLLEAEGLPVPAWREIVPGLRFDPDEWGPWVVVKPDLGRRGIDVEGVATAEVRHRSRDELPEKHLGRSGPLLAQRFIPTKDGPSYYRVTTCFGEPLFAMRLYTLPGKAAAGKGLPVTVDGAGAALVDDSDILALARRVHALLPEVPTIGCDFLRHRDTGQLWISEINLGSVWMLSSPRGIGFQARTGLDLYQQFGALDRAAEAMVEATRRLAR